MKDLFEEVVGIVVIGICGWAVGNMISDSNKRKTEQNSENRAKVVEAMKTGKENMVNFFKKEER